MRFPLAVRVNNKRQTLRVPFSLGQFTVNEYYKALGEEDALKVPVMSLKTNEAALKEFLGVHGDKIGPKCKSAQIIPLSIQIVSEKTSFPIAMDKQLLSGSLVKGIPFKCWSTGKGNMAYSDAEVYGQPIQDKQRERERHMFQYSYVRGQHYNPIHEGNHLNNSHQTISHLDPIVADDEFARWCGFDFEMMKTQVKKLVQRNVLAIPLPFPAHVECCACPSEGLDALHHHRDHRSSSNPYLQVAGTLALEQLIHLRDISERDGSPFSVQYKKAEKRLNDGKKETKEMNHPSIKPGEDGLSYVMYVESSSFLSLIDEKALKYNPAKYAMNLSNLQIALYPQCGYGAKNHLKSYFQNAVVMSPDYVSTLSYKCMLHIDYEYLEGGVDPMEFPKDEEGHEAASRYNAAAEVHRTQRASLKQFEREEKENEEEEHTLPRSTKGAPLKGSQLARSNSAFISHHQRTNPNTTANSKRETRHTNEGGYSSSDIGSDDEHNDSVGFKYR